MMIVTHSFDSQASTPPVVCHHVTVYTGAAPCDMAHTEEGKQ